MATYAFNGAGQWTWSDQHLYGAERLGVIDIPDGVVCDDESSTTTTTNEWSGYLVHDDSPNTNPLHHYHHFAGSRRYEITNHTSATLSAGLGNVMVVINDLPVIDASLGFQTADVVTERSRSVVSATDYYPFGLEMVGRTFNSDAYSFSFNTQMKSPEILPGHTTAMYWEYDGRIGRRWELDPKTVTGWSGYACLLDNPVFFSDMMGDTCGQPGHGACGDLSVTSVWELNLSSTFANTIDQMVKKMDGSSGRGTAQFKEQTAIMKPLTDASVGGVGQSQTFLRDYLNTDDVTIDVQHYYDVSEVYFVEEIVTSDVAVKTTESTVENTDKLAASGEVKVSGSKEKKKGETSNGSGTEGSVSGTYETQQQRTGTGSVAYTISNNATRTYVYNVKVTTIITITIGYNLNNQQTETRTLVSYGSVRTRNKIPNAKPLSQQPQH
jgi:hypothetical protein